MAKIGQIVEALLLLLIAAVLAWAGVAVPVHFRAISPAVVQQAGVGTRSVGDLAADYMTTGDVGPVRLLWEADHRLPTTPDDRRRMQDLVQRQPIYWDTGGPAPYYETFLKSVGVQPGPDNEQNVIQVILPRTHRQALADYLSGSANQGVQALLGLRQVAGWRIFMPVQSPAGQPLDASILTLALLEQSDAVTPGLRREVQRLTQAVNVSQDRAAQDKLEDLLLSTLAMGRQMDFVQLSEMFSLFDNVDVAVSAARRLTTDPEAFPKVYAAALLLGRYKPLSDYLDAHGKAGMEALDLALPAGQGAIQTLIDSKKELYKAPVMVRWLDTPLSFVRDRFMLGFAQKHPAMALDLKIVLLLASGYCLALGCMRVLSLMDTIPRLSVTSPLVVAANAVWAIMFTFLLWVLVEPGLLQTADKSMAHLHIDFGLPMAAHSTTSPPHPMQQTTPLDQATLIALIIGLSIQLAVYAFALMKLVQLKRLDVPARLKLELLGNEDNLFDLGLYVGLAGTIFALVLLATDLVRASLVPAYSSTLMGIVFTVMLKIVHVRPFRRKLLIQVADEMNPPTDGGDALTHAPTVKLPRA